MKKITTSLIALLLTFGVFAQNYEMMLKSRNERISNEKDEVLHPSEYSVDETVFVNDSTIYYNFTSETDSTPYSRYDNDFDALGNRITSIYSKWDKNENKWVGDDKDVYVWDGEEYITYIYATYDANLGDFLNDYKKVYTNNAAGLAELAVYYEWDVSNSEWKSTPYQKKEYIYDGNNNLVEETYYSAIGVDTWEYYKQYINSFDAEGNQTYTEYVKHNGTDWYNYKEYSWEFDATGMITYIYNKYDSDLMSYYNYKKEEYENNANGVRTKRTYFRYSSSSAAYNEDVKIEYTIDENGNNKVSNYFDYVSDVWEFYRRGHYFFEEKEITGLNNISGESHFQVYPNPADKFIQVKSDFAAETLVTIYALTGQKVASETINGLNNNVKIDHIPSGMYIVNLKCGNESFSQKLIVE